MHGSAVEDIAYKFLQLQLSSFANLTILATCILGLRPISFGEWDKSKVYYKAITISESSRGQKLRVYNNYGDRSSCPSLIIYAQFLCNANIPCVPTLI